MDIWRESMEYNSPSNQMRLLKAAGINPVVAYGGVSNGAKTNPVSMDSPQVFPVMQQMMNYADIIGSVTGQMGTYAMNAEQAKVYAEQAKGLKFENEVNRITKNQEIIKRYLDNDMISAGIGEKLWNVEASKLELAMKGRTVDSEIAYRNEQMKLLAKNIENEGLRGQILEFEKQFSMINVKYADVKNKLELERMQKDLVVMDSQIEKLKSEIAINWNKYNMQDQEAILLGLEIDGKAIENDIRTRYKDIQEEEFKIKYQEALQAVIKTKLDGNSYLIQSRTIDSQTKKIYWEGENEANEMWFRLMQAGGGASPRTYNTNNYINGVPKK